MAHTHGNVVAGEALRLLDRQKEKINSDAECQSEVSVAAYDANVAARWQLDFVLGAPLSPCP